MDQQGNITFRPQRSQTHLSINTNESNMSVDALDVTTSSLPDVSIDYEQISALSQKIEHLQTQLISAHDEIEKLSLQNRELAKTNQELMKKNVLYKKIGNSPAKFLSPNLTTPQSSAKKQKHLKVHKQTQTDTMTVKETEVKETQTEKEIAKKTTQKQEKETQTNFGPTLEKNTQTKTEGLNPHPSASLDITSDCQTRTRVNARRADGKKLNKICIISSQKPNNLQHKIFTENEYINRYDICHYRKSACGIHHLLEGITAKLQDFTMQDFCVIFLGEEDFESTNNNLDLVIYIRETLLKVQFTNIIICLPTFKCHKYSTMFNWRLENFNSLLYIDNDSKHYAYLIDSNLNLIYDSRMFSKTNGKVNIRGFRVILHDLGKLIKRITEQNQPHTTSITNEQPTDNQEQTEAQFFLE